ncbi:hypothetical protein L484_012665 [Morus notabilis]|uniref:Uncharacterized protein n=1 Tax=Morus notabilis TaxID=981085 RepID=W9QK27_9ROSA|nr:hypothetical protein L484_012665 [Morus notabilis]
MGLDGWNLAKICQPPLQFFRSTKLLKLIRAPFVANASASVRRRPLSCAVRSASLPILAVTLWVKP